MKMILRCTEEDDQGARTGVPATEAFIHGYHVAERSLEGVAIRIFHTSNGRLDAEVCLSDNQIKDRLVNPDEVRRETLALIKTGRFDILSSSRELSDGDMMIYDPSLPHDAQACRVAQDFVVRDSI